MPLAVGIVGQALGYRVAVRDETLQHHGQIQVGDRPFAEQILAAAFEQLRRCGIQFLSSFGCLDRKSVV